MTSESSGEYPGLGQWLPANIDLAFVELFPIAVPDDAWVRFMPDPERGLPAVHIDAAWVADQVLHQATIGGFTLGDGDGVSEREVIRQGHLPLASVVRLTFDLQSGDGRAELKSGEVVAELPGALLNPHIH
ncbi:hypothetical protein ABZ957_13285 [Streptomyces sp. NPDC046316]|uniref:hypothetical protein n=1 Tax=Streptomyces sp. NPDC046316 TaxID=3154494 RepID=UPI0033E68F1C